MPDTKDMQQCESCSKEFPIETMNSMEDCWYCEACAAAWKQEFDACDHVWKPYINTMGEAGHVCERCNGFEVIPDA